jgi:Flp pilus assembly CpaE family ATPase
VLSNSDLIVLVTEVNVTALQRARRQLVFLEEHGFGHLPIAVVANRFEAGLWGGSDQRRRAERALGRAIDGFVRSEVKAAAAARDRGLLLEEVKIGSGIAKDMRAVLERLPRQNPPSHGAASRAGAAAASLSGD